MTLNTRLHIRTATIRLAAATSVRSISAAPFLLSNNKTRPISSGLIGLNHRAQDLSTPFLPIGRRLFATVSSDEDKTKLTSKSKMEQMLKATIKIEGLPKYFTRRTNKLENLFDLVRTKRTVLITAPPQSGKTALAQLFVEYVKKEHQDVPIEYISFTGYETDRPQKKGEEYMKKFIKLNKGITLDEIKYKVKANGGILVTDESHWVYHVGSFWGAFGKAPSECDVLSFSIYDDKRIHQSPFIFANKRSFSFVAFTESEFDEVAIQFKSNFPNRVGQKAIDFVRDKVHSVYLDNEASFIESTHKPKNITLFHPGLTYACFDLIAKNPHGYEEDDIVRDLGTRDKLYKVLQGSTRCFPSFDSIATIFEREVKKKSKWISTTVALRDFDVMFSNTVHSLLATQHVNYMDHPTQPILLDLLVRHGLCCKSFGFTKHVYLSCPLMKTHLQIAYAVAQWPRKPPSLDYHDPNTPLMKYAMSVIRQFDPITLSDQPTSVEEGQRDQLLEDGYQSQFAYVLQDDPKAIFVEQCRFYVIIEENGKKKDKYVGRIDFFLNGIKKDKEAKRKGYGIELVRTWNDIKEHVERIDGQYKDQGIDDYLTVYFHQGKLPDNEKVDKLIRSLEFKYRPMLLIVQFIDEKFERVIFHEIDPTFHNQDPNPEHLITFKEVSGGDSHATLTTTKWRPKPEPAAA